MKLVTGLVAGVATLTLLTGTTHAAAVLEAQYLFNNNLNSSVAGAPALTATDPSGTSGFVTDTVFGSSRTVYQFNGTSSPPSSQAGLTFNNSSSLITHNSYSVDLVFEFFGGTNAWRRIIDVQNRQSDNGFYVDPSNRLDVFPVVSNGGTFSTGTYHNVALVVDGTTVSAYLDDVASLTTTTALMDINNADNPGDLVNLFLDNVLAGGQGEWSAGNIALANFYDGVLSTAQLDALETNPFSSVVAPPPPTAVPEPASFALLGTALAGLSFMRRRRKNA